MVKIGFIGIGIMGKFMVQNLQKVGYSLFFFIYYDVVLVDLLEVGVIVLVNLKEVVQEVEFIIVMVLDILQVEDVLFCKDGIVEGVGLNKVVIDMSLIFFIVIKGFVEKIKVIGVQYLDVLVFGGEVGVKVVILSIMVGGCLNIFECVLLLFQVMGKNIICVGGNGDGQIVKVVNQIIVVLNIQVVVEVLLFVVCNGVDLVKVCEVLMGGFVFLWIFEVYGECMVKGIFDLGFCISLYQKDFNLVLVGVCELNLNLFNIVNVQQVFSICVVIGGSNWDYLVLIKGLEYMVNFLICDE